MMMDAGDWIAIGAAVVASAALALEVRRWIESGPRLILVVRAGQRLVQDQQMQPGTFKALHLTNTGSAPTTITEFGLATFKSRWHRFRANPENYSVITTPQQVDRSLHDMPVKIEPGSVLHVRLGPNDNSRTGQWLWVKASHRNKPYLTRIPPAQRAAATEEA